MLPFVQRDASRVAEVTVLRARFATLRAGLPRGWPEVCSVRRATGAAGARNTPFIGVHA